MEIIPQSSFRSRPADSMFDCRQSIQAPAEATSRTARCKSLPLREGASIVKKTCQDLPSQFSHSTPVAYFFSKGSGIPPTHLTARITMKSQSLTQHQGQTDDKAAQDGSAVSNEELEKLSGGDSLKGMAGPFGIPTTESIEEGAKIVSNAKVKK
jgi:hypothetical protein